MHNKSAIMIMMATVMLCIIAGCGRRDSAWMDPPIVMIPDKDLLRGSESTSSISRLIKARDALSSPGASRKQYGIMETGQNESENDIALRFMEPFNEWRNYRSQLPDQFTLIKPDLSNSQAKSDDTVVPEAPRILYVPEYSRSTDILNWKIRIMLLESRLKTAGSIDRQIIETKLRLAKESLVEAERIFGQLVPAAPVAQIVPEPDDIQDYAIHGKEITVADMNGNNIKDTLAGLDRTNIRRIADNSMMVGQSISDDYQSKLRETITDINRVLVELEKRH